MAMRLSQLAPRPFHLAFEVLLADSKALLANYKTFLPGSEALPAGSMPLPASSQALSVGFDAFSLSSVMVIVPYGAVAQSLPK